LGAAAFVPQSKEGQGGGSVPDAGTGTAAGNSKATARQQQGNSKATARQQQGNSRQQQGNSKATATAGEAMAAAIAAVCSSTANSTTSFGQQGKNGNREGERGRFLMFVCVYFAVLLGAGWEGREAFFTQSNYSTDRQTAR